MTIRLSFVLPALLGLAACGDGGTTEPPPVTRANCDAPVTITLAAGQHQVVNPAGSSGCIRLGAGPAEAEYLVAVASGAGKVTESGVSGPFALRATSAGAASAPQGTTQVSSALATDRKGSSWPERFHHALRQQERELSGTAGNRIPVLAAPAQPVPPIVGSERSFTVCKNLTCSQFDTVLAVARVVDQKAAVYMDKVVPTNDSLRQSDLEELARTFNTYHYPISSTAFGSESDKDGNGVVIILLTDAVNALTPDCTNGRILGFFWGGDLLAVNGSNQAEVFYAMVPAPKTDNCTAAERQRTLYRIKPTLIHEFQHMVSFNQHALVRGGTSEETWLNEGLSHFSEELAGRLIPSFECAGFTSCRSQYSSGNLFNVWDYLEGTEGHFLVMPDKSSGTLEERGAGWMFVRWQADQFGNDSLGTNVTRSLVQTSLNGAANISAVSGVDFPTLVGEWLLATYADDLPGFTPASLRITFKSWGFRKVFQDNCCASGSAFDRPFPFNPVPITSASFPYARTGTLRGGSGQHFSVVVAPGGPGVLLLLSRSADGPVIDPALEARLAIARLR
jgi:hypothetical protein